MHNEAILTNIHHHDSDSTDVFGFWIYILTDCILFGCLFATFLVLNNPGHPGPALKNYVNLHDVLIETFLLLISNFTFCLAILNLYRDKSYKVQLWLAITFLLGAGFISMEVTEFIHMANEGFRWDVSGAISSFFTLVGTHGLHVGFGLLWIIIMIVQLPLIRLNQVKRRRMTYLGLFWNFLDIVWIFVFTIVYLMGAI
ncbi:cytochrome o ubiquinol oxidase subunit III [Legionella hackeliae]|uniref:Cytochrome bo(3) ubiquinol oxidase subunit 3 n=1 Tax=Legionella hackeliae TaxID=449 RepID=A0A0A8USU8_LEGHA|nr:cytochrome o ubiquinol oxidase subunit III [Legionella hackeliae]KTD14089.1 cytochrome o ubiquinol oxidase subunit III cyoC [Legionella hackeliae]CEK10117.1 Cytochrome o ubiquinol oxidase subunit 3 [Legionella hackeliae]STX46840.1 cytochrome o ubiquinol oxidase subunit III cyoC [Legionella hackeliae]